MKYILSGGGTGGHIYPALAICDELTKQDKDAEIIYVGKKDSLEAVSYTHLTLPTKA